MSKLEYENHIKFEVAELVRVTNIGLISTHDFDKISLKYKEGLITVIKTNKADVHISKIKLENFRDHHLAPIKEILTNAGYEVLIDKDISDGEE